MSQTCHSIIHHTCHSNRMINVVLHQSKLRIPAKGISQLSEDLLSQVMVNGEHLC